MLGKKVQAAIEYLMTYGWAILAVLIAIGALSYLGVLSPEMFQPSICVIESGLSCIDYLVETDSVSLFIQNNKGQEITINKITASANGQSCYTDESINLKNGDKALFAISQCNNGEARAKYKGNISIEYVSESGILHNAIGTIKSKIDQGDSFSSSSVCQNAQDNFLCDGLDIVYGIGYESACCSEHTLCC